MSGILPQDLLTAAGILLNNQADDFSTPGQTNTYGLEPTAANFIRPGKKVRFICILYVQVGQQRCVIFWVGSSLC